MPPLRPLLVALVAAVALPVSAADAATTWTPDNAVHSEAWITEPDGTKLHVDILRPKGLGPDDKTPVVLSIGPYFNKSGQVGPAGPTQGGAEYDPVGPSQGASVRFRDLVEGAKLMERGYTFVAVDLRGFGGSSGCLDWGGPGETADVVESVKWAATQSWSNGRVGMYGKSYDAVTGLIGVNQRPPGLAAVVAQEPVYDMYRYLYGDGQRRNNSTATPALYDAIGLTPGTASDVSRNPDYELNGNSQDVQRPGCFARNWADQAADDDHYTPFWRARNLITGAKGSHVPLLLTQGLTENNTVADGLAQYMEAHTGYERAWLGPWEHVRGNEACDPSDRNLIKPNTTGCGSTSRLKMGREGWFDEVVRFYDEFLKDEKPAVKDPMVAVQTNDGQWREEDVWPPADAKRYTSDLRPGSYVDSGNSTGSTSWPAPGMSTSSGVWTVSQPLPHDVHLSGSGRVQLDLYSPVPRANVAVDVYDLPAEGNSGPLVTRQGALIRQNGQLTLDLWSADWKFAEGRRIAVRVTETNREWWLGSVPTRQTVTVYGGEITLPFLGRKRTKTIAGEPGVQLASYLNWTGSMPSATPASTFQLPPEMKPGEGPGR